MISAEHRPGSVVLVAIGIQISVRVSIVVIDVHERRISKHFTPYCSTSEAAAIDLIVSRELTRNNLILMDGARRLSSIILAV